MAVNGHFAGMDGATATKEQYEHGIQVISEDQEFNPSLSKYLALEHVLPAGFNYHLISVFGSQSTGKSTLLNHLFGTEFGVMSEAERRQTTKGIWMSKNKRQNVGQGPGKMADNILVMDVEGTDGRERGEDQDFERKAALFALATSEVLIVNIWEHQVGLYQGANMGLLKVVFEVNLELFLKDNKSKPPRSLLFFVIRDHLGATPLANLRNTLIQDLSRIWAGLNKPKGLEKSRIEDYFDFAFAALPHKILQPERFVSEVGKLGTRFREGQRDARKDAFRSDQELEGGIFLPDYHRRIPADGIPIYAEQVWEQIVNNKDLDLPTQQELMAQFRCDEIAREALELFDEAIVPFENKQAEDVRLGAPAVLGGLGSAMRTARMKTLKAFETEASRYHKGVYTRKKAELEGKLDTRLKAMFKLQLTAAHKSGVKSFSDAVTSAVKAGQKKGTYDFASIVDQENKASTARFEKEAKATLVEGAPWSTYKQELALYAKDLNEVSARLRHDELRRLATRTERWVKTQLSASITLEFNSLGSGRGSGAPVPLSSPSDDGSPSTAKPSELTIWDRIWRTFTATVSTASTRFSQRATSFDATPPEVQLGLYRLRRKSWSVLHAKLAEELSDANILLLLRENFEDKFRYDDQGVPRIWRPTDDIEGAYTKARESTLQLIPLLSRFQSSTPPHDPPPLAEFIGEPPEELTADDEEDLIPIAGLDDPDSTSLSDELTLLPDPKRQEIITRFRKAASAVFVEAKRGALGGITQVPLYFYGILLALGWNEILAVLRNPLYFVFLILLAVGAYVVHTLGLWGPILQMTNAASKQAVEEAKKRLREVLEASEGGGGRGEAIKMSRLDGGKEDDEEGDEI